MTSHRLAVLLIGLSLGACNKGGGGVAADAGVGQPCDGKTACPGDLVCAGGTCEQAGTVGLGGQCWASRDCQDGLFCTPQGVCGPAGTGDVGATCGTAAECKPGLYCDLFGFTGQCQTAGAMDLGGTCGTTADCLAGLACGNGDTCQPPAVAYPPFAGVDCAPDEATFRVLFEVPRAAAALADFYRLPYPTDVRVDAAGALHVADFPRPGKTFLGVDLVDLYVNTLTEDFTGFSSVAPISFRFSKELDFATADSGDVVHLADVTMGSPDFGHERGRAWSYTTGRGKFHCQQFFTLNVPADQPLLSGHTYAAWLTTAIRAKDGGAPVQDPDLVAVLGGTRPTDADLGHAWDVHAGFRAYLGQQAIAASTIAGAAVFTVQDTTGRAERLAAAVATEPLPALSDLTLCGPGVTSPCEDATGRGKCGAASNDYYEVHGRYTVPIYQQGTAPYERPADGGGIVELAGVPQKVRDEAVCFALTIPRSTMPVGGWPLVIFGHGTGGSYTSAIDNGVAGALAKASTPMAVFGYEGVVHGARKGASLHSSDELMFNLLNPRAARDNNLQGAVDILQAVRLPGLAPVTVDPVGAISFDPAKVYYFGHSQGSNVGVPAIAVSDAARAAIFSGAGAHLSRALLTKTSPVNAKAGLEFLIGEEITLSHPLMVMWQTFFDSVDTVNYAPLLLQRPPVGVASKHIFMTFGDGDTYSPQPTLGTMARAAGLPVVQPAILDLDSGLIARPVSLNVAAGDGAMRTAACFQYSPSGYDGHFVSTENPAAVVDWVAFLTSLAAAGTPTVP